MYIWLTNFGCEYSAKPASGMDGVDMMKRIGFECTLHDDEGNVWAHYNPITGRVTTFLDEAERAAYFRA
jgi:hypothetical protein